MANETTPAFKYVGVAIEAFVPTDSGATVRVPKGKYVVGSYYTGLLAAPEWLVVADASGVSAGDIVYENMGELGNKLVFVPVPTLANDPGNAGDIAVIKDSVTHAITTVFLCTVTTDPVTGHGAWSYFTKQNWPA
jgi:hypothetical protein